MKSTLLRTCVLLTIATLIGCNGGSGTRAIRGSLPTSPAQCYEFVLLYAATSEQADFFLETCEDLLRAREAETAEAEEEDVSIAVAAGGATGRARVRNGRFSGTVYNSSGYDLTELVFEVRLFETQEKEKRYEESLSGENKSAPVEPDEIRRIRIRRDHPNLTVMDYSAAIGSPLEFYGWQIVGGRGVEDPHAKSRMDELLEKLEGE